MRIARAMPAVSVMLVMGMGFAGGRCPAQAPPREGAIQARAAMAKLDGLVGRWEGDAVVQLGPGDPIRVRQREHVERKLDGEVLLIEGLGSEVAGEGRLVFQAIAVVSYDPAAKEYRVHAFRDGGMSRVADAEVTDTGMIWGFEDGRGGRIRYTITLEGDTWHEVGEYLREGQPPRKSFEMTVKRLADPAAAK